MLGLSIFLLPAGARPRNWSRPKIAVAVEMQKSAELVVPLTDLTAVWMVLCVSSCFSRQTMYGGFVTVLEPLMV